jgi:hypothetical protein
MLWRPRPRRAALSTALHRALLLLALSALLMLPATGTLDGLQNYVRRIDNPDYYRNLGAWEINLGGCTFSGNTNGGEGSALKRSGSCTGDEMPVGTFPSPGAWNNGRLDLRSLYITFWPSDAFRGMPKLR